MGPSTSRWVSRQLPMSGSRPRYSSPTLSPPAYARTPSTTTILRWLRKLSRSRLSQFRGPVNRQTVTPAASRSRL